MSEAISKSDAQKRADRIRQFNQELQHLQHDGVLRLSTEQRQAVSAYHEDLLRKFAEVFDIDVGHREKQLSLGMRIASFLGALGFSASLFFLFYRFWGAFPTTIQVVVLLGVPLLLLTVTWYVSRREHTGYFSKILALLTLAAFVLNLVMYGQMFNLVPTQNAFLAWSALAFLLAYATGARLLVAAGIIALAGFLSAQMGTWSGCYWLHFGERPENFFAAAAVIFLLGTWTQRSYQDFLVIYRIFGLLLFFVPLLILANWGRVSYLPYSSQAVEVLYQTVGFLFSAAAIFVGMRTGWRDVVNCGNVFFVILLYTKFFDWWWEWMPKYLFFLIIGLTALLFLLVFQRLRRAAGRPDGATTRITERASAEGAK